MYIVLLDIVYTISLCLQLLYYTFNSDGSNSLYMVAIASMIIICPHSTEAIV